MPAIEGVPATAMESGNAKPPPPDDAEVGVLLKGGGVIAAVADIDGGDGGVEAAAS